MNREIELNGMQWQVADERFPLLTTSYNGVAPPRPEWRQRVTFQAPDGRTIVGRIPWMEASRTSEEVLRNALRLALRDEKNRLRRRRVAS